MEGKTGGAFVRLDPDALRKLLHLPDGISITFIQYEPTTREYQIFLAGEELPVLEPFQHARRVPLRELADIGGD